MALETFKIFNAIAPPCLSNIVKLRENTYNFRYSNILQVPSVKTTTYGKNSFRYAANVLWNSFPDSFREKGRDLTQSYDKSPYTNRNVKRAK